VRVLTSNIEKFFPASGGRRDLMLEHSIDVERWNVLEIFRIAIPEDIFDCPKCCIIVIEDGKDVILLQVELFRNFFCPPFVEIVFFIRLGPVFTENIVLTESELEVLVVEAHFVVCQAQVFEVEEDLANLVHVLMHIDREAHQFELDVVHQTCAIVCLSFVQHIKDVLKFAAINLDLGES